jgi:hypothetical protein
VQKAQNSIQVRFGQPLAAFGPRVGQHRESYVDVLSGVRVAGEVHAVFEHIEPRDDRLPSWLDLTVPDDRFTASSMLLQAEHPEWRVPRRARRARRAG